MRSRCVEQGTRWCDNIRRPHYFESKLLALVLKLSVDGIVLSRSFVESGGDSASAATFLYQQVPASKLQLGEESCDLTAVDILHSDSDTPTMPIRL